MDGHTGVPSEPLQSSVPANKTTVPCFYFFNGFCNKGNRCSFLHGPSDSLLTVKPLKNDNGSSKALNSENKTSSGNITCVASAPSETHFDRSLSVPKALSDFKLQPKEVLQVPLPENVKQKGDCLELSASDYKETAMTRSNSLLPDDGVAHNMSHLSTEQSSDEQINSHVEPEERWESSPGFDVLVHDESGNLGYEDDSEYLPVLDMNEQELNEQYSGYEFKDTVEYDTLCSDTDILYEQGTCDDYRCFDSDFTNANGRKVCGYSREMVVDSIFSRKRIRMSAAEMSDCDSDLDLRDHLRRRREGNVPPVTGFLRRHDLPSLMVRNSVRHQRQGTGQRQNRRLTSQLEFSSMREVETLSIANKERFRPFQQNRPRKHYGENLDNRPFLSSMVSRKPVVKQQRFIQESTTFSGPKTLAEIKEEKKKKKKVGESSHRESISAGFQDPKPLSEILKDRRTIG